MNAADTYRWTVSEYHDGPVPIHHYAHLNCLQPLIPKSPSRCAVCRSMLPQTFSMAIDNHDLVFTENRVPCPSCGDPGTDRQIRTCTRCKLPVLQSDLRKNMHASCSEAAAAFTAAYRASQRSGCILPIFFFALVVARLAR